jgi:hypothetical protein
MDTPSEEGSEPRRLHPAPRKNDPSNPPPLTRSSGSGDGPEGAGRVVDALKSSADQELTIAERISSKARQAFALAAAAFVVAQTVAFGNFEVGNLSTYEKHRMIGLAIASVVVLTVASFFTIKADATVDSRDLQLGQLEDDLNAAYNGDPDVTGRIGSYYLGVVRTRRKANDTRRTWYKRTRAAVALSLLATAAELIASLYGRTS